MSNKFTKNDKGFTGLEAAIVLVAFVVVAAVFSYVMLGAGFYTTQKSQEVVHTGVTQASSSVELSGDVLAKGDGTEITDVTLFLQLTSGGSSVDVGKTLIVYSDPDTKPTELTLDSGFTVETRYNAATANNILDKFEKFEVNVPIAAYNVGANDEFQLEIKPPQGASYTIHRQAPASIDAVMTLV
ncbi:MAG: archaellin/type IV pilin N-terminal domain-containing protein [Methanosarcina sp.]|uniref:archaellin/type IV pilin N-terminal domain-containing protein n=1 Tax=Methanosarcina sp. TaxID=2213 RepID=UPI003BB5E96A